MIWENLGLKAASLGTLGLNGKGLDGYGGMTTPDPVSLFSTLADVSQKGFTHLAMEASSHGLHQYRLDGVKIKAAGFTNLTRDHLDYHGTMEKYLEAKLRLFTDILVDGGTAVLNADIPEFQIIEKHVKDRGLSVISYGLNSDAHIRIIDRKAVTSGQDVTLSIHGKTYESHLNLVGAFQLMNVLCALGLVISDKAVSVEDILSVLPKIQGVTGRLQPVPHKNKDLGVYIDYAHTPDGLETILNALRPHTQNKLICVFGCGGDRDRGKRPVMGEIAQRLSDIAIITDDNPRSEDPQFIRAEILSGAPNAIEIAGRRNAIQFAVKNLKAGDVLVVAGKGHEQGQIFANYTEPFDDLTETQSALHSILS
jgi:UDP-N-acetylmuramoyl-L-alanyl-D-glutamate--2,6-diaminopimelate ligase